MGAWGRWNIDASRYAREIIAPREYLRMSYYERRLDGLVTQMIDTGLVTREEIEAGRPAPGAARQTPALRPEQADRVLARSPSLRAVELPAAFAQGNRVRARNIQPQGHTRLPRYARGKTGVVVLLHGVHVFPDTSAHGKGEQPHHLYCVRFEARELWGENGAARDAVHLDLWERYLERA
jgi:nitrile hydratase